MMYRAFGVVSVVLVLVSCPCGRAVADEVDDLFGGAIRVAGTHFTVWYQHGVEPEVLAGQLNVGPGEAVLAGVRADALETANVSVAEMFDTLFLRVCDVLDMHVYSFQGTIAICRDQATLQTVYRTLFERELHPDIHAFYAHNRTTIYATAQGVTNGILSHEIAHAVISHYFVVLPSVKIQEVLAGYVEYQLGKNS